MRKIILIGGAPTTGKSTLAKELAKHFDLPWISTDQIRHIMRATVDRNKYNKLLDFKKYTAEKFFKEFTDKEIVKMEIEEAYDVWEGLKVFIKHDFVWRDGFILEGLNILPSLVNKDFKDSKEIKTLFLADKDDERIRQVVFERGLWDEPEKYSDKIKEREIGWVKLYNDKIRKEAEKYNMSVIDIDNHKDVLKRVLKVLK